MYHEFQFLHFNSFMPIQSFIHSFIRSFIFPIIHSFIHSFILIQMFHIIHLNSFMSCISFHFFSCQFIQFQLMSFQPTKNSCKQTGSYSHVPFSKLSPWRVPGTTWYHIIFFQHRFSNRHMLCQHAQDVMTGRSSVIGFHQNSKCHGWEQRFQSVAGDSTSAAGTVSRHGNHFQMDMFHTWMVTTSEAQRDYEAPQSDCFPHIYSDAVSYISWACLRFAARLQPRDKNWTRPAWSWYWARRSARCCWLQVSLAWSSKEWCIVIKFSGLESGHSVRLFVAKVSV